MYLFIKLHTFLTLHINKGYSFYFIYIFDIKVIYYLYSIQNKYITLLLLMF